MRIRRRDKPTKELPARFPSDAQALLEIARSDLPLDAAAGRLREHRKTSRASAILYDERRLTVPAALDCSAWFLSGISRLAHEHNARLVDVELNGAQAGGAIFTLVRYVATVPNDRFEDDVRRLFPHGWDLRFRNIRP